MAIQSTIHVLAVLDLSASATYYRDILGFTIEDIGDPGWRMFINGNCRIMAGHCPDATPASELSDHSYFAYLVVDDVYAYYQTVVSNGAELIKPLRSEPWGMREFGVRTIDGHRMMIGQDLDP
ncbi:MAG: VOC family protein [Elainellaceae cyanobacterium]